MRFIKTKIGTIALGMAAMAGVTSCQAPQSNITFDHQGDSLTVITVSNPKKYLLLPIQENSNEGAVKLDTGNPADTYMDVRLSTDSVEYYVPFVINKNDKEAKIEIKNVAADAICWDSIKVSDTFDTTNREIHRPVYHHTPLYGWMNDANGLVYKDGEYHLYFQYNPYGSMWGNMHWGHSVSKDLINWEHLDTAIERDTLGHIFSGSAVVDKDNTAGFGKDAIIAFYTSASDKNGQIQCLAYSNDNGRTYTKYDKNPILTPFDGIKDFRDPTVFWYEAGKKWVMIVSADKEMRIYESKNLKDWEYMSAFGEGYGPKASQFECPAFVQMPLDGDKNKMKWVLIVNINPGCLFGGSATQYFVGDFDGKEFKCDTAPDDVKWLDYGKDHYATVCFSNTGNRVIGMPWMSNWQYAMVAPTKQFRSANALPREFTLYTKNGETLISSDVVPEARGLRKDSVEISDFTITRDVVFDSIIGKYKYAFELSLDITPGKATETGFDLYNDRGEIVKIYLDMTKKRLVMDRTESGIVDFAEGKYNIHPIENHDERKTNSVNYKNDFALGTWAPLSLCDNNTYHLDIFVDKSSIEIFVDGGRIVMTNTVFPTTPYDLIKFYSKGGEAKVTNFNIYELGF